MIISENIKLEIPEEIGKNFLIKLMGGRLNPQLEKLLSGKREICIDSIGPKAIYSNFEIEKVIDNSVYFKTGNVFNGPNISKILKGSVTSTIFIATLGGMVDKIIRNESDSGDILSTVIMNAITTELLTILVEHVGMIVKKDGLRKQGWASTCMYSPGQYKWTIEEQREIFALIDGNKIGVELNKSYLMVPFKSISGVYGFGPIDKIDKTRVSCDLCPRENCISRR